MSTMKLTLIGLETYLHQNEQSLFDELVLPDGINKEDVTNNILLSAGEFEALYADPYFLRSAIGLWGRKHYRTFDKWITALNLEYNPLENYDRIENWDDASNRNTENTQTLDTQDERSFDSADTLTLDTTNERTLDTVNERTLDTQDEETRAISDQTTFDKDTTTKNDVSAYDSGAYQPSDKSVVNEDGTVTVDGTGTDTFTHSGTDTMANTGTDTMSNTGTETTEHSGSDTTRNTGTINNEGGEDTFSEHSGRIHGNVGVTTSQQMLQSELDISRFNLVEQITDLFVTEFCIMVYD